MKLDLDHLTLRVSGITPAEGRRLAGLVARRLARADAPMATIAKESVDMKLTANRGESLDSMARRIAVGMQRSLGRPL